MNHYYLSVCIVFSKWMRSSCFYLCSTSLYTNMWTITGAHSVTHNHFSSSSHYLRWIPTTRLGAVGINFLLNIEFLHGKSILRCARNLDMCNTYSLISIYNISDKAALVRTLFWLTVMYSCTRTTLHVPATSMSLLLTSCSISRSLPLYPLRWYIYIYTAWCPIQDIKRIHHFDLRPSMGCLSTYAQ